MRIVDKKAKLETYGKLTYIDDCYDNVISVILTPHDGEGFIVECDGSHDGIEKMYTHIKEGLYKAIGHYGTS